MVIVVDYELKKKVMDAHIDDVLKYCYQCARCTDVCPVSKVTNQRYNPRPIILNSFLGIKSAIFSQPDNNFNLWGCTMCDTCDEECPQKIELTEIFTVLKNMSIAKGEGPKYYTTQASTIYETGKAIPMQTAIERRRKDLGLPVIESPNLEEVNKLLNATKLNKILNK
jgi:heterodisulfide reductase subunit C